MALATSEADEVQQQMRSIRAELREDVQELVVSAREMADWTIYVRAYPWLCVGAAAALGYFLIPQRTQVIKPDMQGLIELAKQNKLIVKMEGEEKKKRRGMAAQLIGAAAGLLLQGGLAFATKQFNDLLDQQRQRPAGPHSPGTMR